MLETRFMWPSFLNGPVTEIKFASADTNPLGNTTLLFKGTEYLWQNRIKITISIDIKIKAMIGVTLKITAFAITRGTFTNKYNTVQMSTCTIFGSYIPRNLLSVFLSYMMNCWCWRNKKDDDVMLNVNNDMQMEKTWVWSEIQWFTFQYKLYQFKSWYCITRISYSRV